MGELVEGLAGVIPADGLKVRSKLPMSINHYDVIIIGTGAGGGTLAYALADWGKKILLLERGDFLPKSTDNWSPEAVFDGALYKAKEKWLDQKDRPFSPGMNYYVGGNTKVYGAALVRMRREDFGELRHVEGISPGWPVSYEELEPFYLQAEKIYNVHGLEGDDPTDPPRSGPYPRPAVSHEPYIDELAHALQKQGLHPFHLPIGIDLDEQNRRNGKCVRCRTCDGFPCLVDAKSDAANNAVIPALKHGNITLLCNARVEKLCTNSTGSEITSVEAVVEGEPQRFTANLVVVACGAVNSAALLLGSANDGYPEGLANSSGLVGRNYMAHNNAALMAVDPRRPNPTSFQKSLALNDFYFKGPDVDYPLGNLQLIGKLQKGMLAANKPWIPRPILQYLAEHSVDWWVMTEDLPNPNNRVTLTRDRQVKVIMNYTNTKAHLKLLKTLGNVLRKAGYPIILTEVMDVATCSHQVGTLKFGHDPKASVLDTFCRSHDIKNLFVVDASFFPSSSAVNPALTIMAQALRVGQWMRETY